MISLHKTKQKECVSNMFKKIGVAVALSTALLFGGAFSSSANAQAKAPEQNQSFKAFYSINGNWQSLSKDEVNNLFNKYMKNVQSKHNKRNCTNQAKAPEQNQEQPIEKPTSQNPEKANQANPNQEKAEQQPNTNTAEQGKTEEKQEQAKTGELSQFEQEVVDLTNKERAKQGLPALKIDAELSKVAREKSRDMAANGYFSHNSPTYGSPFDMMKQFGIRYSTAGENIAKGQRSPQEVVNAWMNSEGHRANIMNAKYTHIGVGYVEQGNHWTQQFIGK
jgi:uncharacterized YkwD family protein